MRVLLLDTSTRGRLLWAEVDGAGEGWRVAAAGIDDAPVDTGLPHRLASVDLAVVDLVAVTLGPGSYTGVRAGVAAALGIGAALGIPVHGCSALELLGAGAPSGVTAVHAAVDAGRGGVYVARVRLDPVSGLPCSVSVPWRVEAPAMPVGEPVVTLDSIDLERAVVGAVRVAVGRPPLDPALVDPVTVTH